HRRHSRRPWQHPRRCGRRSAAGHGRQRAHDLLRSLGRAVCVIRRDHACAGAQAARLARACGADGMTVEAMNGAAPALRFKPVPVMPAAILVAAAAVLPWVTGESFLLYIATLVAIYAIGAMSIHLIFRVGQFSLGQAAFMGIGGYTSSLLTTNLDISWWG